MKKLFAILITVVMVLSLSATAFAATGSSITVENAKEGETYKIYKLLDLSLNDNKNAFTYTIMENSPWYAFFSGAGASYVSLEENDTINGIKQYVVTPKYDLHPETEWAGELAALAITYANDTDAVTPLQTIIATEEHETAKAVTFDNLDLGYYMVETSIGTLVALESNNINVPIKPKNPTPRVDKQVQEDSDESWGKTNTADIGDTVNYKLTLEYVQNLKNLVVHDIMSDGLTLDPNSIQVSIAGQTLTVNEDYTVLTGDDTASNYNCDFEVTFPVETLEKLTSSSKIVITYSATVNENAIIRGEGNPNEVRLAYGDNSYTDKSEVKTYIFDVDIFKYTKMGGDTQTPLAGAKFIIARIPSTTLIVDETSTISYALVENGKIIGWTENQSEATVLESGADGEIHVDGFDSDNYQLIEIEAPAGYNKITKPIEFSISNEGIVRVSGTQVETIDVENRFGNELPSTGGIGTTIFITIGIIGVLAMGVFLVTNKRMKKEGF